MSAFELPSRYLERMQDLLGSEFPAFQDIYTQPPTHGLRVNTLKLTPIQFETISPFPLSPISWSPTGFLISDGDRPGKHPYHAAGLYYIQDPHAQAVAEILAAQPGERVLDLTAAPGGKATHLASRMENQGLLVANEIKTKRVGHLVANLERWGAHNVVITNETPERMADFFGAFFDRVLVDAPCSGEGMFRRDPASRQDWSEGMITGCAVRQTAILNIAARLVRPGGWLCYSTCTFAPEEDEDVVFRFLDEHCDFEIAEAPVNFTDQVASVTLNVQRVTSNVIRLWPHRSSGEGHFVALMRRSKTPASSLASYSLANVPRPVQSLFDAWCDENLTEPLRITPTMIGTRLYAIPDELPELSGLRVIHPGWWLGTVKSSHSEIAQHKRFDGALRGRFYGTPRGRFDEAQHKRFEPAHALAMGLRVSSVRHTEILPLDSPDVIRYLRCEPLYLQGEAGWVLVCLAPTVLSPAPNSQTSCFPLGWGKHVQGVVKNHYPRGLQWL